MRSDKTEDIYLDDWRSNTTFSELNISIGNDFNQNTWVRKFISQIYSTANFHIIIDDLV